MEKRRFDKTKSAISRLIDAVLTGGEEVEQGWGLPKKRESVEYTGPRYDDPELLAEIGARLKALNTVAVSQAEVVPVEG